MAYNINELLELPLKERREISSLLINSLPEGKLSKEEIEILNDRWESHLTGKSKSVSSENMKKIVFNK